MAVKYLRLKLEKLHDSMLFYTISAFKKIVVLAVLEISCIYCIYIICIEENN